MHAYASNFIPNPEDAEEIVQNVFCRIWEKRQRLRPDGFLTALLYRAVYNECANYHKHHKVRASFRIHYSRQTDLHQSDLSNEIMATELEKKIHKEINNLPEKCRAIFQMSRFEEMKYQQIASQLDISIKTVENQMGKALKTLRSKLIHFLPSLLIYLYQSL